MIASRVLTRPPSPSRDPTLSCPKSHPPSVDRKTGGEGTRRGPVLTTCGTHCSLSGGRFLWPRRHPPRLHTRIDGHYDREVQRLDPNPYVTWTGRETGSRREASPLSTILSYHHGPHPDSEPDSDKHRKRPCTLTGVPSRVPYFS